MLGCPRGPCGGGVEEGLRLNKCTLGRGPITNGSHSLMGYCAMKKVFDGLLLLLSCFSHVQLFATLWTVAYHVPLSVGFSRSALESRRVSLGAHWVDSRESSLLRRLERGREIGR